MSIRTRHVVALLGAAAMTVPSAAVAAPGKGKAPAKSGSGAETKAESRAKAESRGKADSRNKVKTRNKVETRGKGKAKKVKLFTYVVKGVYDEAGNVDVTGGNSHTRRAGLVGKEVSFDFSQAKLVVADTNGDDQVTLADLQAGDKLVVQLKLPRALGSGRHVARKVVDQTNPPVEEDETEVETPAEAPAETPEETPTTTGSQDDGEQLGA